MLEDQDVTYPKLFLCSLWPAGLIWLFPHLLSLPDPPNMHIWEDLSWSARKLLKEPCETRCLNPQHDWWLIPNPATPAFQQLSCPSHLHLLCCNMDREGMVGRRTLRWMRVNRQSSCSCLSNCKGFGFQPVGENKSQQWQSSCSPRSKTASRTDFQQDFLRISFLKR